MWNDDASGQSRARSENQPVKQLEHLNVLSGNVLIIDQFMLGNRQFVDALPPTNGQEGVEWVKANTEALRTLSKRYGGSIVEVDPGDWAVLRDPTEALFVLGKKNDADAELSLAREDVIESRGNAAPSARVYIDTRCVVFVDAAVLANAEFLAEYRHLRETRQDKVARDFLRNNGAAVRYGFNRDGDELGVFITSPKTCVALWPDVVESGSLDISDPQETDAPN